LIDVDNNSPNGIKSKNKFKCTGLDLGLAIYRTPLENTSLAVLCLRYSTRAVNLSELDRTKEESQFWH